MLNPDGVINGNYRNNVAGCDLNRKWDNPNPLLHPTIFAAKKLILSLNEKIVFFCDFHGSMKKFNCFLYGCYPDSEEEEEKRTFKKE